MVYCSAGRQTAAAPAPVQPAVPAAEPSQPAPAVDTSTKPAGSGCSARLFNIIKKPLGEKKFGPSEFEETELGAPEAVDCMVKDGFSKPEAVVGAEWAPNSSWQRDPDAPQRRAVKVYVESL